MQLSLYIVSACLEINLKIMQQKEMLPLAYKISTYLADYNDFIFHPLKYQMKGFSEDEIIAALDELEKNNLVELQNFKSKEERDEETEPRTIDINEVAGRKIILWLCLAKS